MKKTTKILMLAGVMLLAFSMVGCEWFIEGLLSVSGTAVNVMAAPTASDEYWKGQSTTGTAVTLAGAEVSLTPVGGGTALKGTVQSNGTWSIANVSEGKYIMNGSHTGWTFIPAEIEVTGLFQTITQELLAYPDQGDNTILLIVKWNNLKIDVDSHLVIDTDEDYALTEGVVNPLTDANFTYPDAVSPTIKLDRDVKFATTASSVVNSSQAVETIRIISNPFGAGNGWLRYYLNVWSYYSGGTQVRDNGYEETSGVIKGGTLTGNPDATTFKERADATVYIMQGKTLYGTWPLPVDTAETTLGIVRIQVTGGTPTSYTFWSFGGTTAPRGTNIVPVGVSEIR